MTYKGYQTRNIIENYGNTTLYAENSGEIERLINERNEARRSKNFSLADTIRKTLREKGIEIEDTDKGTIWRKSR